MFRARFAAVILSCSPRTLIEASEVLFQGLLSQAAGPVIAVIGSLFDAPDEVLRRAGDEMPWFVAWAVGDGKRPFPADRMANFVVRMLQFRIAVAARPDLVPRIAKAWDSESARGSGEPDALRERFLLASLISLYYPQLDADRLVFYLTEVAEIEKRAAALSDDLFPKLSQFGEWATSDIVTELFRIGILRNATPHFLGRLISAISDATEEVRTRMLAAFRTRPEDGRLLIDGTWTYEQRQDKPNWDECIKALQLSSEAAEKWGLLELAAAAVSAVSVIYDEYLDREEEALGVLAAAEARLGNNRILAEQRATVALNRKRYHDALGLWDRLYPLDYPEPTADDLRGMLAARKGGEAAGRAEEWRRAAGFFLTARAFAKETKHADAAAELLADAGFAYWKDGEGSRAVDCFDEALRLLDTLPDPSKELRSLVAFKRIGHVLVWMSKAPYHDVTKLLAAPSPGMCSQPGLPEEFRGLPQTPAPGLWILLAELEFRHRYGRSIFEEATRRLASSPILLFSLPQVELDIRHSLREGEAARAVDQCLRLNTVVAALQQIRELGGDVFTTKWSEIPCPADKFGTSVLEGFLLRAVGDKGLSIVAPVLGAWKHVASDRPRTDPILAWLDEANEVLSLETQAAYGLLVDQEQPTPRRLLAALRIAPDQHCTPEATYGANITLFDWLQHHPFSEELLGSLGILVSTAWRRHAKSPALLLSPRLTVPEIELECASDNPPPKKIARILLAARHAVTVRLANGLADMLRHNA